MSEKIDPREVLAYLNELGYTNITAQQLKEFIKDLKKVIKYESRPGGIREAVTEEQSYFGEEIDYCECSESDKNDKRITSASSDKENQRDNLLPLYKNQQQQKPIKDNTQHIQRDKHIAVHIYDTKNRKYLNHDHCVHINSLGAKSSQYDQENLKVVSNICAVTTEATIKSVAPNSRRELMLSPTSKTSSKQMKSKAFIRPAISKSSINKSDPVALYHYYQSEWKRSKIPGEVGREDLRWAIRARMLSGPKVEVKSRCNIPRCGWSR